MRYDLFRSVIASLLLTAIILSTGDQSVPKSRSHHNPEQSQSGSSGSSQRLPSGVSQSDWGGILQAHEEWKHSIRADGDGWRTHNPETGLTARFDRRGVEVQPEGPQSADWTWGLELVSHGIGTAQLSTVGVVPEVHAAERRIGYVWDENLEEWYQNDGHGLEHGYTIRKRPASKNETDSLVLRLRIRGELRVVGEVAGRSLAFGNENGKALLRYSDLKVLDAAGRDLPASFESDGEYGIRIRVDDASASYPVMIDPIISQQAYLKASNAGSYDFFGWSVAISGETVVVGAPNEASNATGGQSDNSASQAGAAYVFVRNGTTWSQQAYLKASNAEGNDDFGLSVAISGDTVVVGAQSEASSATGGQSDNSTPGAGAAYVYARSGTTWSQQAYLKASNAGAGADDYFGLSVAISGDTVVVGATGEDSSATGGQSDNSTAQAGAAYVFVRNGTTWSQQAYLKASNAGAYDFFGWSVAISGETVVVGAWGEDSSATGGPSDNSADVAGAAYIYVRSGTTWSQQAFLKASNAEEGDLFGHSVTISGETVVVGAYGESSSAMGGASDNSTPGAGAAYVYARSGTTWSQQAYLKASNAGAGANDYFGYSVAISGETIVVGAPVEDSSTTGGELDNSAYDSGASYVFVRSGTMWSQQAFLKASNAEASDQFGWSVAISGENVVVGAIGEDSSGTGGPSDNGASAAGAAYVFTSQPQITIGIVEPPVTAAPIGPGSTTTITQTLTNNTSSAITGTFVATLPGGLNAIGCTSPFGSCGVTTTTSGGALNGTNRSSSINTSQTNQTVTWTGTIPANGSVTITYQVQVGVQVTSGSKYCITSMIGATPGPTTCIRVNTPSSGPGNMPVAAGLPNQQKPGSLLIFNLYTSSVNTSLSDTQISLTNTNPVSPANVHLFFVDGSSCSVADQIVTLTQNQTVTFRASDVDPGVTGYLIAVAVDQSGCPVAGNYLIGVEDVRFESGHHATLAAIGVSALSLGTPPCLPNSVTATLAFNGIQYDELPRGLGVASLPSLASGNSPMLIINRIGGDMTSGAERLGPLAGLLFDDGETSRSFTLTGGTCQLRGMLGNNLPRTVPRYATVIPAGRTGWMKFWAAGDEALSGVMINAGTSGFSGGYNLQTLTTTNSASLVIPVIPVR